MNFWHTVGLGGVVACLVWVSACGYSPRQSGILGAREAVHEGDLPLAATLLATFIMDHPGHALHAMAYNDLGVIQWKVGNPEAAVVALERSRGLDQGLAAATYNLGVVMLRGGDTLRAAALFSEAAQRDPNDTHALEYSAHLGMIQGRWGDAAARLWEALEQDPQSARILTALSLARLRTEDASAAITSLLDAIDADPEYAPPYYNLGVIHDHWLQDQDSARQWFVDFLKCDNDVDAAGAVREWLEANPINPGRTAVEETALVPLREKMEPESSSPQFPHPDSSALYEYGVFLMRDGRDVEALTCFRKAVASDPRWIPPILGIAQIAVRTDRYDSAQVALERILRTEPAHRDALWLMAVLMDQRMDRTGEAMRWYKAFIARHGDDPMAKKARQRLTVLQTSPDHLEATPN